MKVRPNLILVPTSTSLLLFCALVYNNRIAVPGIMGARDSAISALREDMIASDQLIGAGETLPEFDLSTYDQESVSTANLHTSGYEFLYLYREGCPACEVLKPFWTAVDRQLIRRVAFVSYKQDADLIEPNYYTVALNDAPSLGFGGVPTLLTLRDDGRVSAVAHSSIYRVGRLMAMHGLLQYAELEDSIQSFLNQTP